MSDFQYESSARPKLALAGFGAVVALGLFVAGSHVSDAIAGLRAGVADTRALIARAEAATETALPIAVYEAATAEEARARVQGDIQRLADAHDLEIETIDPGEIEAVDGLVRMGFKLKGSISQSGIAPLLTAVQQSEPAILLQSIWVRRARGRMNGTVAPRLPLRLEVSAYARL